MQDSLLNLTNDCFYEKIYFIQLVFFLHFCIMSTIVCALRYKAAVRKYNVNFYHQFLVFDLLTTPCYANVVNFYVNMVLMHEVPAHLT